MDINKLKSEVHSLAWEKGWHSDSEDENKFIERTCNLMHDEICELHESWRKNELHSQCDKGINLTCLEEEFADLIIRALDSCAKLGIDIEKAIKIKHEYNKTRSYRHGGKKS